MENLQHTGSFKLRGAFNKLLSLSPEQRASSIVTASSGNHGAATAYALAKLGANGMVFVPEQASSTKVEAIKRYGAEVRFFGTDGADTEIFARQYATEQGMTYISPYNDLEVIAGQGTIGVELEHQFVGTTCAVKSRQRPRYAGTQSSLQTLNVFITVGGGGLVSGIAGYLKSINPNTRIIGCQPENDAAMLASVKAGQIRAIEAKPTLSDGSAGGLEPGAITFELCRTLVDEWVAVSEEEIKVAIRLFMETQHQLIEGAAGVAVAAMLKSNLRGERAIAVICGANISLPTLKTIL